MQVFYGFAAVYLAIALWAAHQAGGRLPRRTAGRIGRSELRAQFSIVGALLTAGLLWPERWRALLASFWDDPSIG